jgi:LPXTG-motif cell wall-anchored protein
MKRNEMLRVGTAVCAFVIGMALPGIAAAQQASGGSPPPGVGGTSTLPKTGNPDADTTPSMGGLPAVLVAGGAMTAFVIVRRRMRGETDPRE